MFPEGTGQSPSSGSRVQDEEEGTETAHGLYLLAGLNSLGQISLIGCDFYGHHLFRLIEDRGNQITKLELTNVDEINLNALLLIGQECKNLKNLALVCCHFQVYNAIVVLCT